MCTRPSIVQLGQRERLVLPFGLERTVDLLPPVAREGTITADKVESASSSILLRALSLAKDEKGERRALSSTGSRDIEYQVDCRRNTVIRLWHPQHADRAPAA